MPKPRKKRSLTGTEEKQDAVPDCSQSVDQDPDVQKSEMLPSSDSPVPKRAKVGKLKERQHDSYCWNCHFEDCSEKCSFCPRVYHMSCLPRIENSMGEWMCPECQMVVLAEKNRANSPVMSLLSTDQLCNLLKYSLQRMEMHVPKDFSFGTSNLIIYPMDLPLLEKNIRKRVYTSPAAFLADAKWIIHNHTVHFPLAVPAIKTIMKVCQEEVREIETCPDCYLHAYSMKDKWFSEPCRKPHTLVWAKLKGFPIWPAKAVKTFNGSVDVRFFGGHERAWVPVTQCYFLSRDPPQPISSQKKNFEVAYQEVELHIKLLTQRFGGFEYAPDKTPFNPAQIYLQLNVTLSKLSYLPQSSRDKRKQEVIPVTAKRRFSRAHSMHDVQGNRKDDEKKEMNLDTSAIVKEPDQTDKKNDCSNKTESLSSTEAVESHEEKSVDSDFVTKESVESDFATKESVENDFVTKESVESDVVTKESADSDFVTKESVESDVVTKESVESDFATKESVENDFVTKESVDTKETTNDVETVTPLLTENISKESDSTEVVKLSDRSIASSESEIKEENCDASNLQDEERTEIPDKLEVTVVESDRAKSCEQQNDNALVCQQDEKRSCTPNSSDHEMSSTVSCIQNAIAEDINDECDKDNMSEVLCSATNIPVSQEHGGGLLSIQDESINADNKLDGQLIASDSMKLPTEKLDCSASDSMKLPKETLNCADNIGADLKTSSEEISSKSVGEAGDGTHDVASKGNINESKSINVEYSRDEKKVEECNEPEAEQAVVQEPVLAKHSTETQPLTTNVTLSTEDDSHSCLSSDTKETALVVKSAKEEEKTLPKESAIKLNSLPSIPSSNSAAGETSKEISVSSKAVPESKPDMIDDIEISNKSDTIIDNIEISNKSDTISKEVGIKLISITDHDVKVVDSNAQRTTVINIDEQTDVAKGDKFSEKTKEFHTDESHLDKNPSTSNSLRIRIVKGKIESEGAFSNSGKESEITHKIMLTTEKPSEEGNDVGDLSKTDLVQNNESQIKTVAQISEQIFESTSKQETDAANTIIRKSKRPRKNIIIKFPRKQNQITHSNPDDRDPSSTVALSDGETNAENSNHPDEPCIIKDFKATIEKIKKGKFGKGPVVGKVIDYKSHGAHVNETQQTKPLVHQSEAQKVKLVKPSTSVTNCPVIIKVPVSNLNQHKVSSSEASSSSLANHVTQTPCSFTKPLQIAGTKSLQIIALGNRTSCSSANSTKHPDSSATAPLPRQDLLHYKETEVNHCSNNLDSELASRKGETSTAKSLNTKDQCGAEVKIPDKCANTKMLPPNVQVSLKDISLSGPKESSSTTTRSQEEVQNMSLPFGDKEKNLFNILPVEKYARKLTVFLTNTLEEMCQDIINSGCMQVAVHSLETELENVKEKYKKDLADVKQNAELVMKEMRAAMEAEKQNAVAEVRRQCEIEMRKNVEEAKKKQWCANCGKEAVFYCCWNTSYCDYPCQQSHWPQHMAICGQSHVPSKEQQQIIRTPNLGPDMTITQSPPVLPLEIQLTTPTSTQTNKNKKKPSASSSEKITIAPRGKNRLLTQSPNANLQPHDIARSSHMIYSSQYRLQNISYTQGGQVIPMMLPHNTPHQQHAAPNVVLENKSHNVQHTVSFQYNPHACM